MKRLIAALALFAAACGQTAAPPAEIAPSAVAPAQPITGHFAAMSNTAMSLTGDLDVTADALSFARGFRIEGARVEATLAPSSALAAGQGSFADATSNASIETMELRQIALVRVAADAAAPSLCGDQTPTFVVLARGAETLNVLIFSGIETPGAGAQATSLCGIYNYSPA